MIDDYSIRAKGYRQVTGKKVLKKRKREQVCGFLQYLECARGIGFKFPILRVLILRSMDNTAGFFDTYDGSGIWHRNGILCAIKLQKFFLTV